MTNVEHAIGLMEGKLGGLDEKLDMIIGMQKESEMRSLESRRSVHSRLDAIEDWQVEVKTKYAFGKGAAVSLVAAASALTSLVTWAVTTFFGSPV